MLCACLSILVVVVVAFNVMALALAVLVVSGLMDEGPGPVLGPELRVASCDSDVSVWMSLLFIAVTSSTPLIAYLFYDYVRNRERILLLRRCRVDYGTFADADST